MGEDWTTYVIATIARAAICCVVAHVCREGRTHIEHTSLPPTSLLNSKLKYELQPPMRTHVRKKHIEL